MKIDNFSFFNNLKLSTENIDLIRDSGYGTSRTAFRKSLIKDIFPLPEKGLKIEADLYFNLAALWYTNISSLEDYLTIYRVHGKNLFSVSDVERLPLQIESMKSALKYLRLKVSGSKYYDQQLFDKLSKPYQIEIKSKEICYNSFTGKDPRRQLFQLEIERLKYHWGQWSIRYKIYKFITIPLSLIIPTNKYLDLKDKYYKNKFFKVREAIFPSRS
jgi:hypothetical protein